jgi:hypothetical protein
LKIYEREKCTVNTKLSVCFVWLLHNRLMNLKDVGEIMT